MPTITARRFPQYAQTSDPEIVAAYLHLQASYDGFMLTAQSALSQRFTGSEGNAVIAGSLLAGARIRGFRHLDEDAAPGRWSYRDGIYTPHAASPAHEQISAVVHEATPLPGRPFTPVTGMDPATTAMTSSRGAVFLADSTLYSGYPVVPEEEFTGEPIGQGWTPISAEIYHQAHTAAAPAPVS